MCEIIGNKWSKRLCRWIAMTLTVILSFNQSSFSVLAAENTENKEESVCVCDVRCNADSVNEACPVCTKDYGKCEAAQPEEVNEQPEDDIQEAVSQETASPPALPETEIPVGNGDYESMPEEPVTDYFPEEGESANYVDETASEELPSISESAAQSEAELTAVNEAAVMTQEELAAALLAGVPKITLTADISLTAMMIVPASAEIVLDGQGFSLYRGADENGAFIGTMLYLSGAEDGESAGSLLTLTNVCVDGRNAGNRTGSSAIINYGRLILDEGAVVRDNYNYGTYLSNESGEKEAVINDYGGGIQVYGELTVMENALITGNFADEFGGGVYLADGATLYLHADVIRENMVADGSGYGADLYAATGSTIYYNTAIDMTRAGFYLCTGVNLIGMDMPVAYAETSADTKVEVYINISENSGYTKDQIAEITSKLEQKGYTVLSSRTNIDTTDLRDWYVFDHYDPNAWNALGLNWEEEYGGNNRRIKYQYAETYYLSVTDPVYTIEDWLERQADYTSSGIIRLAQFKEHIDTRKENGYPKMTFVGYGDPAYVDFLFYDPESDGEKVVDFDIDSSQIKTHTLTGSGFLVNTGIDNGNLYGYLVYYAYSTTTAASSVKIYYLNGISAESLHNGSYDFSLSTGINILGDPIVQCGIPSNEWQNEMSIQIKATPTSIEVRQQPKESSSDINQITPILSCELSGSKYSGFGPLVAYRGSGHNCTMASSFTYSNLRMYFTNPPGDMLDPLERADFTQEDTQKYFINLFGNSESEYNSTVGMGQYENYLKIMQNEGIALITDRDAPFEEYLGESNAPDSNLCEIQKEGDGLLSVDSLIEQIIAYVDSKETTKIQDKLQSGDGEGNLTEVNPNQSVGNIWLMSTSSNKQIRTVNGDFIGGNGFEIQIMDDITYYRDEENQKPVVTYYIIKPNGDIETLTSSMFMVGADSKAWPAGEYTVQQKISNASVQGYAYFELTRTDPETGQNHAVTVNVRKDDSEWSNSGKEFALAARYVEPVTYISNFNNVPNGVYSVYDTTDATDIGAYEDTGVTVTVSGSDAAAVVDYYTVTIYDDESDVLGTSQIVRKNEKASEPTEKPTKDGCTFNNWSTSADGNIEFDFASPITAKTNVYTSWLYAVTINVHKDGDKWEDNVKTFALAVENEEAITFFDDLSKVQKGDYNIYDTTGTADINAYEDTGITVTVSGAGATATIDYYTVTLYNDDTVWGTPQIVRKNAVANAPAQNPTKDGYSFYRWCASKDDSSTDFNFGSPITAKTDIYASWLKDPEKTFTITVSAGVGGSISPSGEVIVKAGDNQQFVITPEKGYQVASILVDNNAVSNNMPITFASATEGMDTISGSVTASVFANTNLNTNENSNIKYYLFENVTENHTLTASFEPVKTKSRKSSGKQESDNSDTLVAPVSSPVLDSDTNVIIEETVSEEPVPSAKDSEPKTGDGSRMEIYATIGMIAGLSYLLLYFADGTSGMTEEEKKEIVGALVKWARKGKRLRKYVALAIVFVILVYYHSIGKRTSVEWNELYEK